MTTPRTDSPTQLRTTVLTIDGMTCGSCVRHVQHALADLDGVHSVDVQLSQKQAQIVHDSTLQLGKLLQAVAAAGYDASERTL